MTAIETIAGIIIIFSAIKILVILVNPAAWMNFARSLYSKPGAVKTVAFVLAAIVLYYLVQSGLTIVDILAVTAFVALLVLIGLAGEVDDLIKKYQGKVKAGRILKDYWFYTLLWIILLVWGAKELFF